MQVLYLGRALRTKETLPNFLKWRRVTRHPLVFCRLTGSQRTLGFGASQYQTAMKTYTQVSKENEGLYVGVFQWESLNTWLYELWFPRGY